MDTGEAYFGKPPKDQIHENTICVGSQTSHYPIVTINQLIFTGDYSHLYYNMYIYIYIYIISINIPHPHIWLVISIDCAWGIRLASWPQDPRSFSPPHSGGTSGRTSTRSWAKFEVQTTKGTYEHLKHLCMFDIFFADVWCLQCLAKMICCCLGNIHCRFMSPLSLQVIFSSQWWVSTPSVSITQHQPYGTLKMVSEGCVFSCQGGSECPKIGSVEKALNKVYFWAKYLMSNVPPKWWSHSPTSHRSIYPGILVKYPHTGLSKNGIYPNSSDSSSFSLWYCHKLV